MDVQCKHHINFNERDDLLSFLKFMLTANNWQYQTVEWALRFRMCGLTAKDLQALSNFIKRRIDMLQEANFDGTLPDYYSQCSRKSPLSVYESGEKLEKVQKGE